MKRTHSLLSLAVAALAFTATPAQAPECPSDVNGDCSVNVLDLIELLLCFGQPALPPCDTADIVVDGTVNVLDLIELLLNFGQPCLFDYGPPLDDPEAEQIGLEMLGAGGPLLVPQAVYDRIDLDLDLIRASEPALGPETHSAAWLPNEMLVKVLTGFPLDDYQCLNAFYQVIDEEFLFSSGGGDWYVLTFAGNLNVPALAVEYAALAEIEFAEPNGLIGGQNFWVPTELGLGVWRWDVDDGFLDCFDGCDCHNLFVFETTAAGGVTLISFSQVGAPWCEF
jgi:hypothetical protein